jgi:hypothetical protein
MFDWRLCAADIFLRAVMLIANRALTFRNGDKTIPIAISIFAPEKTTKGAWGCRCVIQWPDQPSDQTIFGFDSVQALFSALQIIGAEIYSSSYHKSGQLFFDSPGGGYGFPVAPTLRDLLVGNDAKFL